MSIRPIDYSTMVPKTQEVSNIRQTEYNKTKVQLHQGFVQQNNKILRDQKRINDTNKSENSKINIKDRKKRKYNKKRKKKENKHSKEKEKKRSRIVNTDVGGNIDIRI